MPPPPKSAEAVPKLAGHARLSSDPLTHRPLLLYPEGILELEETAAAALALCDGHHSLARIASLLAREYEAPEAEIAADVREYLDELTARGLVRWEGA